MTEPQTSDEDLSLDKVRQRLLFGFSAEWSLHQITFINSLQKFWSSSLDKIFEDVCKKYDIFRGSELFDLMGEFERDYVYVEYPNMLWSNVFATTFHSFISLTENICRNADPIIIAFEAFCNSTKKEHLMGIRRIFKFLEANNLGAIKHYQELITLSQVRNAVVHNGGSLRKVQNEEAIRDYVKKNNYLTLGDDRTLMFSQEFVLYTVLISHSFIAELYQKLHPDFGLLKDYFSECKIE